MIKTELEIINDIFGDKKENFTRKDLEKGMSVFAKQFKWVKTTCGKNIEFDDLDYEVLRQQSVFFDSKRGTVMALWFSKRGKRTVAPVAKLLVEADGKCIIHYKDRNPLNLRRNNIELINHQKSHFKQSKPKTASGLNTTSNYKGVSWNKFAKKWSSYIKIDFEKKHLGYFINEEDAAIAYNKAAIENFGKEYAELNILPFVKYEPINNLDQEKTLLAKHYYH